jgi:hypothetical protein
MVEHPTGLAIYKIHGPNHKFVDPFSDRPIAKGLPSQIEKMEADYQENKETDIHRALVLRVFAIGFDVLDVHRKNLGAKLHN